MHSNAIFFILFLLLVAVSSDSEFNHLRAPITSSHLARRLQDEATEDLTWLLTGSNLTTGTTLHKETNYHVAMSKDGSTVAVGSPQYNRTQGVVRVHRLDEATGTWYPLGDDIKGDLVFFQDNISNKTIMIIQSIGLSLDLSDDGNILIAGYQEGGSCRFEECRSYAKVFRLSQDRLVWEPFGSILLDSMFNFEAGWSVALAADGLTAAVGAPSFYRWTDGGQVRVYSFDTDSSDWIQIGEPLFGQVARGSFGFAVDLSADGRTVAVGAPYAYNLTGYAEVWTFNENGEEWEAVGEPITAEVGDETGYRVVLSDDASIMAVSYGGYRPFGDIRNGLVRVFQIPNGQTDWEQLGSDILPMEDTELVDWSFGDGRSLGISSDGQTLAVGAPASSFNCIIGGLARVLRFSLGDWSPIGSPIDSEKRYGEDSNWGTDFVALSGNGKRLVVGGPLREPNWREVYTPCRSFSEEVAGSIRVFDLGLATMPPSTQPTLAPTTIPTNIPTLQPTVTPTSVPSTSDPTSNPAPGSSKSTAQPTASPTLAPSKSQDTLPALPSAALTQGLPSGYVVISGISVIVTFLLYL